MELSTEELQYLLNAIDTHIRTNGLTVAATGAILAQKIQQEAKAPPAGSKPQED